MNFFARWHRSQKPPPGNPEIEQEVRRMAAAFGVTEWRDGLLGYWEYWRRGLTEEGAWLQIEMEDNVAKVCHLVLGEYDEGTGGFKDSCHVWTTEAIPATNSLYNEQMVRGLYRLGIENEEIIHRLNYSLTAHEQLELRHSMPREFWPQRWLEELGA